MPEQRLVEETMPCTEARAALRVISLNKMFEEMTDDEKKPCRHYIHCDDCRREGLDVILGEPISCMNALLEWARKPGPLWLDIIPGLHVHHDNLIQIQAIEHVWGKFNWENQAGGSGWEVWTRTCTADKSPCTDLFRTWQCTPLSSHSNGEETVYHQLAALVRAFAHQGWPTGEILKIQTERIQKLVQGLRTKEIPDDDQGCYNSMTDLGEEIQAHIHALQSFVPPNQSPK
ncbi:hypothetical protein ACFL2D_01860 [Patescibacteria group bacterium]